MAELGRQSRRTNREAMEVLQANGLTLVDASPDDVQTFKNLVESAEAELSGNAFSLGAYQQIQEHLRVFRQTAAPWLDDASSTKLRILSSSYRSPFYSCWPVDKS